MKFHFTSYHAVKISIKPLNSDRNVIPISVQGCTVGTISVDNASRQYVILRSKVVTSDSTLIFIHILLYVHFKHETMDYVLEITT